MIEASAPAAVSPRTRVIDVEVIQMTKIIINEFPAKQLQISTYSNIILQNVPQMDNAPKKRLHKSLSSDRTA